MRFSAAVAGILLLAGAVAGQEANPPDSPNAPEESSWREFLLDRPADEEVGWTLADDPRVRLTGGGTLREQFEWYHNLEFGTAPVRYDGYFLHRLLVHADVRIDSTLRLFGEVGDSVVAGKQNPLAPIDQDEAYIHQAFVEVGAPAENDKPSPFRLRVGRQELSLGSGRLVSVRDGPNVRRTFDGARFTLNTGDLTIDAFGAAETTIRPDNFDNRIDDDVLFWGVYGTLKNIAPGADADLYYLGVDRRRSVYGAGVGPETRHSIGGRFWGRAGAWDYNFEPVVQVGRFGDRDVLAWTIASDTGVRLGEGPLAPRLGLRANIVSGGSSEGRLRTFQALFPNNSYFSEASIFAPANLIDVNPTITLHPRDDLTLTVMWDVLWRYDTDDAVYGPPGVPILTGDETDARFLGHSLSTSLEWRLSERLTLFGAYVHYEAGPGVSRSGGRHMDYVLVSLQWTF